MKRIALVLALALTAAPATAATLSVGGHAPSSDNHGTCAAPQLLVMGTNPFLRLRWQWWPAGGDSVNVVTDSLAIQPGAPFTRSWSVVPGLYRVRGWATDLGGASCDTVITSAVSKDPPDKVRDFRSP